ncbi:MAG TPA: hypothetical protein VIT23_05035, partial [Terrimicrobiaceae bacterium]
FPILPDATLAVLRYSLALDSSRLALNLGRDLRNVSRIRWLALRLWAVIGQQILGWRKIGFRPEFVSS